MVAVLVAVMVVLYIGEYWWTNVRGRRFEVHAYEGYFYYRKVARKVVPMDVSRAMDALRVE